MRISCILARGRCCIGRGRLKRGVRIGRLTIARIYVIVIKRMIIIIDWYFLAVVF